ncbi:hypothetical protein [Mesonia mobilis]|uniref:hypothetical protein n=1 Tax=Mesonia mobilis TaxID=369791 RepID=UPI0026F06B42|nr:hypothetical protein [Mesonia mobilis]
MKTIISFISILLLVISSKVAAQESQKKLISVEESLAGIQLGVIGISGFYEAKLANNWTVRGEMGLRGNLTIVVGGDNDFYVQPEIALSPRLYYNLKRRAEKGKNIANNSANFLSLYNSYRPDWFSLLNDENQNGTQKILTNLLWGLRRSYGNHFHLEFAAGLGYYKEINLEPYMKDDSGVYPALDFRIGYQF